MRVLLIAPQPFFQVRGTPLNVLQMCRALTEAGHQVHLATYPLGEDVALPGLTIHRCARVPGVRQVPIGFSKRKIVLDVPLAFLVFRLLLSRRFDVVHAVEESIFFALPAARLARLPVIYDLDSSISDQLEYAGVLSSRRLLDLIRSVERAALGRVACAITVCRHLTDFVRKLSPDTPVFQVEDAPLPASLRQPVGERVEQLRQELDLVGRRVFVYTGNFEAYQGIDVLLQALPLVVARHPEIVVVLVGGDEADTAALRERAARLDIIRHVRLTGHRDPDELPEFMALAEGLLSPRIRGQNTPLKIYTYMYSRRPIIATDLPTHTQVLDSTVALLVPATPEGLARGMLEALEHPDRASRVAVAARERVEREYSIEAFGRKLSAAYTFVESQRRTLNGRGALEPDPPASSRRPQRSLRGRN